MMNPSRPHEAGPDSPGTAEPADPADPADARRVRLAGFWAIVLRQFRDQVQSPGDRGFPQARPTEEDR